MARLEASRRLAGLARLLHAAEPPRYVRAPIPPSLRRTMPNEGWYWVPPGGTELEFMGRDAFDAYHLLMCLLEELDL